MDSSDWVQPLSSSPEVTAPMAASMENKRRPNHDQALVHCPRCDSPHTKFCYYNNYSLSQPRYFCRSCRRYWTKGGTLRNIPVGGVGRKSKKRCSTSRKLTASTTTDNRRRSVNLDGNGNVNGDGIISSTLNSLQFSYPESPAEVSVYPNFTESGGGGGPFAAMVACGGYGSYTGNAHGLNLFGEMEHYENLMNEVDVKAVKPRVLSFEWEDQTGCHSDIYGSGEAINGSFSYLMGLGSHGT